jgi:hypothetical protein
MKSKLRLSSLFLFALLLNACNLPRATPVIPSLTPFATNTPPVNTPTPTPPVPLPSNPTPTSTTITGGATGPINLLFATGTTALVASGSLQPGQSQEYTINVGNSQPMILILTSTKSEAVLAVYDAAGNVVLDPSNRWTRWQSLLSQNVQHYKIRVVGGSSAENFNLTVKVAARINFASGATSATISASTVKGYVLTYAVRGIAGQTLTASIDVPAGQAVMDIFGLATGDDLLGAGENEITFTGILPSTQDYIVEVFPTHGDVVAFTLSVIIH